MQKKERNVEKGKEERKDEEVEVKKENWVNTKKRGKGRNSFNFLMQRRPKNILKVFCALDLETIMLSVDNRIDHGSCITWLNSNHMKSLRLKKISDQSIWFIVVNKLNLGLNNTNSESIYYTISPCKSGYRLTLQLKNHGTDVRTDIGVLASLLKKLYFIFIGFFVFFSTHSCTVLIFVGNSEHFAHVEENIFFSF